MKDISSNEKRMMNQIEQEYMHIYGRFKQELDIVKELNKQLPKSIKKLYGEKLQAIKKKIGSKKEIAEQINSMFTQIKKLASEEGEKEIILDTSEEAENLFLEWIKTGLYKIRFNDFIRNMSLIYLTTELESFLRSVLSLSFKNKPEILSTCQKSISYEEIAKYSTIEDARQDIIEKEISALLCRDIEEINRYFEQKFNLNLSEMTEWKNFKETFYRRNIIVHNSGIVNQIYRSKTGYKSKEKSLSVSYRYLNKSITLFDKFADNLSKQLALKFNE